MRLLANVHWVLGLAGRRVALETKTGPKLVGSWHWLHSRSLREVRIGRGTWLGPPTAEARSFVHSTPFLKHFVLLSRTQLLGVTRLCLPRSVLSCNFMLSCLTNRESRFQAHLLLR